jgi:hypothetical protein
LNLSFIGSGASAHAACAAGCLDGNCGGEWWLLIVCGTEICNVKMSPAAYDLEVVRRALETVEDYINRLLKKVARA